MDSEKAQKQDAQKERCVVRFRDCRKEIIKRTEQDDNRYDEFEGVPITPRRISAFLPGQNIIKPEVLKSVGDDIRYPTYNRARRRASGNVKPRKRIRGQLPPHPVAVLHVTHKIEREGERQRIKQAHKLYGKFVDTVAQIEMIKKMDAEVVLDYGNE